MTNTSIFGQPDEGEVMDEYFSRCQLFSDTQNKRSAFSFIRNAGGGIAFQKKSAGSYQGSRDCFFI
jgi:hypothetical protein